MLLNRASKSQKIDTKCHPCHQFFSFTFYSNRSAVSKNTHIFPLFSFCRPVDTPQSYSKGPQPTQVASRSAASPLSPPRQGATTNYPPFSGMPAREAPINRYVQQSPYGAAQVSQFHETFPFAAVN